MSLHEKRLKRQRQQTSLRKKEVFFCPDCELAVCHMEDRDDDVNERTVSFPVDDIVSNA